jgi:DMSO/TMAO reductase YedYZ heme-binding membrane subunit
MPKIFYLFEVPSMMLKRLLSIFAYVVVPVVGVGLSVITPSVEIFRQFGELAQLGLFIILFMKPTAFIIPLNFLKRALTYRRQMGVAVFWLALLHSVGFLYAYGIWSVGGFFGWDNFLLYGGVAMLMVFVLGVTSNDASVRFFRENWKRIHFLAYPALFFVLLHSSMSEGEMAKVFVLGGVFIALKLLEVRKFRLDAYLPVLRKWGL